MRSPRPPERAPSFVPDFIRALPEDGAGHLVLFDADGTLWRDDVADDFCRWMIDNGHISTGDRWAEYIRIYRQDHAAGREYMLSFYAGLPLADFYRLIHTWWHEIERCWVPEVVQSLWWLADRGYAVWIVTGSPTDTMLPLLDFLEIDRLVGLDFEVKDGLITGRLAGIRCTDEGKARKVQHLWEGGPITMAAGNGSLDAAMIEMAEQVQWAVYPNPAFEALSRENGWHILPRPSDFVEELKLAP